MIALSFSGEKLWKIHRTFVRYIRVKSMQVYPGDEIKARLQNHRDAIKLLHGW